MASRDLNELLPGTKAKWIAAKEAWNATHGNPVFEVCTYRPQADQDGLWAKGRMLPGPKVTWTRKSKHTEHRAVDFAFKMPGPFDLKADIDADGMPDFMEFGEICKMHGLQWGIIDAKGVHKDLGHVQDNEVYPA
ncbi:MAG: M15 family metallopeptidase [Gallionella sp.]|jgi:hypothetical protein